MKTYNMTVKECVSIKGANQKPFSNAIYLIAYNGEVRYVGRTYRCVPQRLREHIDSGRDTWMGCDVEIRAYEPNKTDLLERERDLIEIYRPRENRKI